jgi:hypothetical protein
MLARDSPSDQFAILNVSHPLEPAGLSRVRPVRVSLFDLGSHSFALRNFPRWLLTPAAFESPVSFQYVVGAEFSAFSSADAGWSTLRTFDDLISLLSPVLCRLS